MKMQTTLLLLAALVMAPAAMALEAPVTPEESAPAEVGSTVSPDIKLTDIYGTEHSLADYRGKIVFIHFWSILCPYEKLAEPKCKALQDDFGDKGVVQIAVNANQRELVADSDPPYANLRDHVEKAGVNFLVTVDPGNKVTDILGGQSTPHCFVIDEEGVLQYSGALDDDPRGNKGDDVTPYVRNAINALLAGEPVPVTTSKPYG